MFPGAKSWKPYWVEIREYYLDISTEYAKEPFTSYHIGVLKVRPSKDYPDRPDVLEFYDGDGFTSTHFFVFTYDPFDILEFFKTICTAYKGWREKVTEQRQPLEFQCEVKPPGFFSGNVTWKVYQDRITIGKQGANPSTVMISDVVSITPGNNPSKAGTFRFATKQQTEPVDNKCTTIESMKKLLDAIYTNQFIPKLPPPGEVQNQESEPTPYVAPVETPPPAPEQAPAPQE